jgi:hypothetical protein
MKQWCDKDVRIREFKSVDKVLVLLPDPGEVYSMQHYVIKKNKKNKQKKTLCDKFCQPLTVKYC